MVIRQSFIIRCEINRNKTCFYLQEDYEEALSKSCLFPNTVAVRQEKPSICGSNTIRKKCLPC